MKVAMPPLEYSYEEAQKRPRADIVQGVYEIGLPVAHPNNSQVTEFLEEQCYQGYLIELEHGTKLGVDHPTNITNNHLGLTLRIAWAHILEDPAYYYRLAEAEREGEHLLDTVADGSQCDVNRVVKEAAAHLKPSEPTSKPSSTNDQTIIEKAKRVLTATYQEQF